MQMEAITCLPLLMGHKGGPWEIHEECIVCTMAPLGLKHVKQQKNQAHSLSHCRVTRV